MTRQRLDDDGRDNRGRFAKGNKGGPGYPYAKMVARLRSAVLDEVSPDSLRAIVRKLIAKAMAGDLGSAKEILNRALGPAEAADLIARLEELEAAVNGRG